jgi:DNA-binding beta-propeller fold protein YncE
MKLIRSVLAAALLALSPSAVGAAAVSYAAPAGNLPVQHLHGSTFDAILPSGRIVSPAGTSVVTGMNALGVALSPDGRFAIVTNDDERETNVRSLTDPHTYGGYSLAVVDTATMAVVDRYRAPAERYWVGLLAVPDPAQPSRTLVLASGGPSNAVYAFTLDASGHLTPDAHHLIPIPGPTDARFADRGHSYPGTLVAAPGGRRAYVVDAGGMGVSAIDLATRAVVGPQRSVGYFPFGAAVAGDRLLVTNEGLMRYGLVAQSEPAPAFGSPPADLEHASSLSLVGLGTGGATAAFVPEDTSFVPMDPAPDGLRLVGGAHPTAIVATPNGAYAFVAMTNVDRIATVQLAGRPHVVGGTELRLFDRGPYGTQPSALALSHDGSRLYVALAGLNAIAVIDARDPAHLHRLGLIPTGWYPTALALSSDDRTLYVANTKGFGHEAGFSGDPATFGDANAVWSTLQKIDLGAVRLGTATMTTLRNTRRVAAKASSYPNAITNVVVLVEEDKTFDVMLGDLGAPWGDPALVSFGRSITPNLHALAQRYALAANFFADAEESGAAHQFLTSGMTTLYAERTLYAKDGSGALFGMNEDPEDQPRLGSIFNALQRHGVSYRDYGDLLRISGYDDGQATDPHADDPPSAGAGDALSQTEGLGGLYALNVPAPGALDGHVDTNYPGWNPRITDVRRAHEFIRDYSALVAAHQQPRYTYVWLPGDHTENAPGGPPIAAAVADGDRALGEIVQYLSRLPSWKHTAIFVLPDDAQSARDHVDEYRSYALVISPYAKRHYVSRRHLSTASVLKTSEQLLHLPPLDLGDLLATDMSDCFTKKPDARPFTALQVPPAADAL